MLAELLFGRRSSPENPATALANPAKWLLEAFGGGSSAAGIPVNEEKALGVPIAYACARVIAEALASLPIHVFKRAGKTGTFRELADEHWAQPLLAQAPNELQTSFTWRELIALHALFWGNHYSEIFLDPDGTITFLPHLPHNVTPRLTSDGRRKVYIVRLSSGIEKEVREDRMLHIPAIGSDGITGIAPVCKLRNMYGLALATENFGSKFFANDARPGVIMEMPGKLKPEAQKNLLSSLYEKYAGSENHWKVLVLEEGAKMHTVQMPLQDAQFLETRKLQDVQICGAFKVPPHMVGILDRATFSNIEQQDINFAKHTILPWCVKIEQELQRKLFAGTEFFAKFSLEGLMRGDFKTRMEGYQIGVTNGVYTRNEVRELEDMPPLDNGDVVLVPANLTTVEKLQQPDPAKKEKQA